MESATDVQNQTADDAAPWVIQRSDPLSPKDHQLSAGEETAGNKSQVGALNCSYGISEKKNMSEKYVQQAPVSENHESERPKLRSTNNNFVENSEVLDSKDDSLGS